jgi:guanylate cyclase, other
MPTIQTSLFLILATTILIVLNAPGSVDGSYKKTELSVGYLTAIKGELKDRQGLAISGAISVALDEINNDTNILPNVTLVLRWNDTRGDNVISTRAITEMICDGVATIFGPEGSCEVEAIVAQSRNIPMIAYVRKFFFFSQMHFDNNFSFFSQKCSDYKASAIPTFARTEPPDTQVSHRCYFL